MSAIAQPRPSSPGSPDLAVLFAAVQALPASLAIIESGFVIYANPAWAQTFEYADPSQLQGRAAEEFIPAHFLHSIANAGSNARMGSCAGVEIGYRRQNGAQLHLQIACGGFRMRGKEFQVITTRDITAQKQDEEQVRESQKMEAVGRLVGGVAHDFNNLLTGMMLYCDLLMNELEKDSHFYRHVREMRMAGQHGADLVQQLLAIARPQAIDSRVFVVNDVVAGIEALLARLIGENIALTTSLATDLGSVRMDPSQVQQILLNLVLNARDAMPDGGQIAVATRNCTDYLPKGQDKKLELTPCVELTVTDTGCGMDAETLGRMFEPFFTTKKPGRGNGLGLANARTWRRRMVEP